jgi:Arc/MetJ family transcription regulator
VIFRAVGDHRPYPEDLSRRALWADVPPRVVRLADLITVKRTLDLETLLDEQSTFFGDLFPHVVRWHADLYLEDGLHRALRTALYGRPTMHARVLDLEGLAAPDAPGSGAGADR